MDMEKDKLSEKEKEQIKKEREKQEYRDWVEDQAYCEYGGDYQD